MRTLATVRYLQLVENGMIKMDASLQVAPMIYADNGKCDCKSRCIRDWGTEYMVFGAFVAYKEGKHVKTPSIITDEHV